MAKKVHFIATLLSLLILSGSVFCLNNNNNNNNSAEYLNRIFATKDSADCVSIYFILADKYGHSTASNGELNLTIRDSTTKALMLFASGDISKSNFTEATREMGGFFEHNATIFYIGRIPYSIMRHISKDKFARADVTIEFTTPEKRRLEHKESFNLY